MSWDVQERVCWERVPEQEFWWVSFEAERRSGRTPLNGLTEVRWVSSKRFLSTQPLDPHWEKKRGIATDNFFIKPHLFEIPNFYL